MFSAEGNLAGALQLDARLFPSKRISPSAVHQVVVSLQANSRKPIAHTKDRGDVSGGGRKPWRQKGTGRARHGSIRSPQWKGGGVVFGPRNTRNTSQKINERMKRRVFLEVLKGQLENRRVAVVETIPLERPSTKTAARTLDAIQKSLNVLGKNLLLVCRSASESALRKSTANISNVETIDSGGLGVLNMITASSLVFTRLAFERLRERLKTS